jgi:acetolactate decarboxylase
MRGGQAFAHRHGTHTVHQDPERGRAVYQTSTMGALLDGVYDGDLAIDELLRHGDFGVGSFNHLDGEMLVLGGVCYRLRADGSATIAGPAERTPFATVTWFHADYAIDVSAPADRAALSALVDQSLESDNLIFAVRITGLFSMVRTRTVMEQHRPYARLTEATSNQQETTFHDVTGTMAGYRMPDYEQGISVAGYHLHFIDSGHQHGGHALDYRLTNGTIEISARSELHLSLPRTREFLQADLSPADIDSQIHRTEGG